MLWSPERLSLAIRGDGSDSSGTFGSGILVDEYLAWLTHNERSPNTIEAYAFDLKVFWSYLVDRGLDWTAVGVMEIGEFAAWARQPAIDARQHLRDRLLFALPASTGMRIGQALALRHEDVISW